MSYYKSESKYPVPTKNMERRRMRPFKNMLARGDPDYYKQISKCIKNGNKEMFTSLLTELNTNGQSEKLATYDEGEGETLLHVAVKYQDDNYFVENLINECPLLLKKAREMSSDFHGQTPLHVAITKGNLGAVSLMIEKSGPVKTDLLHTCATGKRFVNTVMMGELPLTVAALKGNFEIVDILIENEADLSRQNHHGDTVFHSLIKYAAIYPEKITPVLNMMSNLNHLIEGLSNDRETADDPDRDVDDPNCFTYTYHFSYIWFLQNHECLTPLQLAAKHGLSDIFEYILNIKDVYCILSTHDGLFDVKQYDISEIDTVCNHKTYHNQKALTTRPSVKISPDRLEGVGKKNVTESEECLPFYQTCKPPKPESVLEMMYSSQYSSRAAFRIIELPAVKNIVKTKWKHYKTLFGIWLIFHFAFMLMYTMYGTERAKLLERNVTSNSVVAIETEFSNFVIAFRWFALAVGLMYILFSVLLIISKIRRPNSLYYIFHNSEYILPLVIFSVMVFVDAAIADEWNESICLVIALICGWWFCVFFLSPFPMFSFFAEMVKRVILGDMLRFGLIITFELIAFTAGMFIVFRGSPVENEGFQSFGDTMLTMFRLGIGIGDIEILYSARTVWAAITLFILFVIFTYLLMLNALIAMMSQTCAFVLEERYPQWRIQQLSVILFLEDIFSFTFCCKFCRCCPGEQKVTKGFDPKTKHYKSIPRYFLEIHSLQTEYATEEDKERVKKKKSQDQFNINQMEMDDSLQKTIMINDSQEIDSLSLDDSGAYKYPRWHLQHVVDRARNFRQSKSIRRQRSKREKLSPKSSNLGTLQEEFSFTEDSSSQRHNPKHDVRKVSSKTPDVVHSDRSPVPKRSKDLNRRRYKSENLHEKETRSTGIQHSPLTDPEPISYSVPADLMNMVKLPNGLVGKPGIEIRNYNDPDIHN